MRPHGRKGSARKPDPSETDRAPVLDRRVKEPEVPEQQREKTRAVYDPITGKVVIGDPTIVEGKAGFVVHAAEFGVRRDLDFHLRKGKVVVGKPHIVGRTSVKVGDSAASLTKSVRLEGDFDIVLPPTPRRPPASPAQPARVQREVETG